MSVTDNQSIYSTIEFDRWAYRDSLIPAEKYLTQKYLDKDGKTLEAGTGGGKILFGMQKLGFTSLYGFDFIPEFIEQAKKKDAAHSIDFEVQNAANLNYSDNFFDQVIYLQQMLCFIEDKPTALKAVQEAHRILKPGGIALFSFLCFDTRKKSRLSLYMAYIGVFRKLARSDREIQCLPWLKLGGKANYRALIDRGPRVYWYKIDEACRVLEDVGFHIVDVGTNRQIAEKKMCDSYKTLMDVQIDGMLYVVCKK